MNTLLQLKKTLGGIFYIVVRRPMLYIYIYIYVCIFIYTYILNIVPEAQIIYGQAGQPKHKLNFGRQIINMNLLLFTTYLIYIINYIYNKQILLYYIIYPWFN